MLLFDEKLLLLLSDFLASCQLELNVVASVALGGFDKKLKVLRFALQSVESSGDVRSNATVSSEFARVRLFLDCDQLLPFFD